MAILQEYYRPGSVDEALNLLARGNGRLAPLAGGTLLVGRLETRAFTELDGVVDLRDAGLGTIRHERNVAHIGAMCTLSAAVEDPVLRSMADGLLLRAARGEGPLNLRNAATLGGVIACAEYDSEFCAALLALDATVTVRAWNGAEETQPLAGLVAADSLITQVSIPTVGLRGGAARVARTPSDRPIVAAYATRAVAAPAAVRVALCGVGTRPVVKGEPLHPPDDFRGSAEYRLAMADIVTRRAIAQTEEAANNAH